MKVLMLAPEPFFKPRGTPFSVYHRCKALTGLGHHIDLLTYHLGEDVAMEGLRIIRIPRLPGIRNVKIGFSLAKLPLWILMFLWAIKLALSNRYDLVHTHEDAVFIGVILKIFGRKKHVYDMHSSLPQQFINYNVTQSRMFLAVARMFERVALRWSDAVITICPSLHDQVQQTVPGKRTVLIENVALTDGSNAVCPDEVRALRQTLRANERFTVLYTGTLEFNQGIGILIDALAMAAGIVSNVQCVLVGGETEQISHFKKYARQHGLEDRVIFTGRRPPQEMGSYMAVADVLVSPRSVGTNTPLKIYSYMNAGKAILATNLYTHTQVLNNEVALLVEPTAEALAEGIVKLARDPELRELLGQRAQALQLRDYSYESFLKKTKELYDHMTNSSAAGEPR